MNKVTFFIQDNQNLEEEIKQRIFGKSSLIIFDDLISSKSLPYVADLFTVDARHNKMSIAFLTQR